VQHAITLLACVAPSLAAQEVSIEGRPECDAQLYARPSVSFSDVLDSAAAAPLILGFRQPGVDPISISLTYEFQGTPRSLEVGAELHAPAERQKLAALLYPLMRRVPPRNDRFVLTVSVTRGSPVEFVVIPDQWTCPAFLIDQRPLSASFARDLRQVHSSGLVDQNSHGTVRLTFIVRQNGAVTDVVVQRSSGFAAVDSAAVRALGAARYRPAVAGRRAISVGGAQTFQF